MPIRAVIFDFGGVLYHQPDMKMARRFQIMLGLKNDKFISAVLASPNDNEFITDIMVGKIAEQEIWEMLAHRWKVNVELVNWLRETLMSRKRLNTELADFMGGLRPRYKTAILSNAGTDARRTFTDIYGLNQVADEMIISAEERVAKPDRRIYQITMERLRMDPSEIVFVDDLIENVEAARQLGINAVHFKNNAQAITEVQRYLAVA
jgi:epoxide hydrolase-like predicted phosphatase